MSIEIRQGDCLEVMATLEPDSFSAAVTDPPYHLTSIVKRFGSANAAPAKSNGATGVYGRASKGFMGSTWDGGDVAFRSETWAEIYRVLKPGAYLLAFGGTRTYHRLACAIEDAGFEIRDTIMWLYASGFPESHDVSKAIDRSAGAVRTEVIGTKLGRPGMAKDGRNQRAGFDHAFGGEMSGIMPTDITAPATEAAREWAGWGTALKPACEPIVVARKPLSESSVAANCLRHGCGAINVDASRVGTSKDVPASPSQKRAKNSYGMGSDRDGTDGFNPNIGRWPANVCHSGEPEVLAAFARFGERKDPGFVDPSPRSAKHTATYGAFNGAGTPFGYGDSGTAARFFFCAKADQSERVGNHPTVKPVALMEWLVGMVTPPGGKVLDPFCGTGSTLVACDRLGFDALGIEQDAQTVADAEEKIRRFRARRAIGPAERIEPLPGQMRMEL